MAAKDSGSSASSSPPPSNSGATQYLKDLPSRGFFTNAIPSSSPGGLRVYICDHDTSPPENQVIKTDSTNILIRSLTLNKSKGDSKLKDVNGKTAAETSKGKRPAERPAEEKMLAKRASTGSNPGSSKKGTETGMRIGFLRKAFSWIGGYGTLRKSQTMNIADFITGLTWMKIMPSFSHMFSAAVYFSYVMLLDSL